MTAQKPSASHHPTGEAGGPLSWAMLNMLGCIADQRNASTAYGRTSTGVEIQVTFCTASPPVVSRLCVWYPEKADVAELMAEPRIIAADGDIVVLCVGLSFRNRCCGPQSQDIFVYDAGGWEKRPSLHLIRYPDLHLYFNVGVLHLCDDNNPNDDQIYIFGFDPSERPWEFTLNLYNSKAETWSSIAVSLGRPFQHSQFRHSPSKVIMMGKEDLIGFVDPMQGILVCDVLTCTRMYHIPLPRALIFKQQADRHPVISCEIVVVQDTMKFVDIQRCSDSGCWKVYVWSRKATWREEDWKMDHVLQICDDLLDCNTTQHLELLPLQDVNGMPQRTLEGLHISHPTLSLNSDDLVYFMAKVEPWHKNAWVLAVDMGKRKLQDVSLFCAERSDGTTLSYVHSRITKYFSSSTGMKGQLKRLGTLLPGPPCKKYYGVMSMDDAVTCHNDGRARAEEEDMDLQ